MPPLRKGKKKSISELLDLHDSLLCQPFKVDIPPTMTGGGSASGDGKHKKKVSERSQGIGVHLYPQLNYMQVASAASTSTLVPTPIAAPTAQQPATAHVSTPKIPLPVHHSSPSQLIINSQFADLVEKANDMGYGRDFIASVIYSTAESGQPTDFDSLLDQIIREGENHDFEPVTVPRTTSHSPSRFVVPPELEDVLLDSIKEIRRDGPVPSDTFQTTKEAEATKQVIKLPQIIKNSHQQKGQKSHQQFQTSKGRNARQQFQTTKGRAKKC